MKLFCTTKYVKETLIFITFFIRIITSLKGAILFRILVINSNCSLKGFVNITQQRTVLEISAKDLPN